MIEFIQQQLAANQFMQGGVVLAIMSWAAYQIKSLPNYFWSLIRRYFVVDVTFDAGNEQFDALAKLLCDTYKSSKSGNFISVPVGSEVTLVPSGSRWVRKGLCYLNTRLTRRELESSFNSEKNVTFSIDLSAYGFYKRWTVEKLVADALADRKRKTQHRLFVKVGDSGFWDSMVDLQPRTFETVYSRHNEAVKADLDKFLASGDLYRSKGIPHRRGYLFQGPPGTGKTSMLQAIANYVRRDLCIINFGSITPSSIKSLFAYSDKLICIEDIDAATRAADSRTAYEGQKSDNRLTLADLLNAIDGVTSGTGNILVMTTNFPEKLDPALVRPGRIDRVFDLSYMNDDEFEMACRSYYGMKPWFKVPENLTAAKAQLAMQLADGNFEKFRLRIAQGVS